MRENIEILNLSQQKETNSGTTKFFTENCLSIEMKEKADTYE